LYQLEDAFKFMHLTVIMVFVVFVMILYHILAINKDRLQQIC